ncbi:MAG TPA: DUF2382 domain-containing protein [Ktedonobacterales bacterium]
MSQQYDAGTPVYDATGKRIGTVSDDGVQGGYLVVRKGRIFHHTVYVPLNAIRRTDHRGIHLRLYKPYVKQPSEDVQRDRSPFAPFNDEDSVAATTNTLNWLPLTPDAEQHDDLTVPLREEQLTVEKQQREMGRVRVHKYIVEEPQTLTVAVTHEELRVERVSVQGRVAPGTNTFTEKFIEMPLMGEDLVVDKRVQVVEEVHLYKSQITEDRAVSEAIRKERLHVDGMDDPTQQIYPSDHLH